MSSPKTETFAAVYDEHIWDVYGFFGYRLRTRDDAEDLTQLTFERAFRAWDRFDPKRGDVKTWLLAIARNLLIDYVRRHRSTPQDPVDPTDPGMNSGMEVLEAPDLGISPELERALTVISQRDREIVALRFGADLTGPEIAELTGLTLSNVQQILSRSLRRLRAELEDKKSGRANVRPSRRDGA